MSDWGIESKSNEHWFQYKLALAIMFSIWVASVTSFVFFFAHWPHYRDDYSRDMVGFFGYSAWGEWATFACVISGILTLAATIFLICIFCDDWDRNWPKGRKL